MRRSCCCCTASRARATCSATSFRCWPTGSTSSPPICRALETPTCRGRGCTFDRIADTIDRFTEIVGFDRYAVYVFDYGAPTGFRLAVRHPDRITAIISQNGNAYEEGLSDGWNPIRAYWQDASAANREALRAFLKPETTIWQYTHGVPDATRVSPDGYSLDNFYLSRPGADEVQLDLFGDYKSNVALYPTFQTYFRTHKPPLPGGVGEERSVLPAAGRRGVQARHSGRCRALLRHRPLRAGDPRRRRSRRPSASFLLADPLTRRPPTVERDARLHDHRQLRHTYQSVGVERRTDRGAT